MFLFDLQLCVVFWRQRLTSLVTVEEGCVSGNTANLEIWEE